MHRILVVANGMLGGAELRERLALKRSTDPDMELFVLVPASPIDDDVPRPAAEADGLDIEQARKHLDVELAALRDLKYDAEGAVGDPDPLVAVRSLLEQRPFSEIILASLPGGGARWLRMDLPHRMERVTKLPVTHIIGENPAVAEETQMAQVSFPGVPAAGAAAESVRVLLVEDNEADAELTELALQRCAIPTSVSVVGNGAEAIEWLRVAGGSGVDLVLVDLKMPVVDGFQLLEMIGQEHDLDTLAVAVLTTSNRMEDRERAHGLGAHAYVTKDASFPLYRDLLESLVSDVARRT